MLSITDVISSSSVIVVPTRSVNHILPPEMRKGRFLHLEETNLRPR